MRALVVMILVPLAVAAAPVQREKRDPKLLELQKERVETLKLAYDGQFERVKIGKDPAVTLIDVIRELADAEYDLADTTGGQKDALSAAVARLTEIEDQMTKLQDAGLQTKQAVAGIKAARLKAAVRLRKHELGQ